MVWKLLPLLAVLMFAGCGHTRNASTSTVSRFPERAADESYEDGPTTAKSMDNDGFASRRSERAKMARHELLGATLDLTGAVLADSQARRRNPAGGRHDLNDEAEALLYSTLIRIAAKVLREVTLDALSNRSYR